MGRRPNRSSLVKLNYNHIYKFISKVKNEQIIGLIKKKFQSNGGIITEE